MTLGPNQLGKDPPSSGPFTVVANIHAKGDKEAETLREQILAIVKNANSDAEPDCTTYILNHAKDNPHHFLVYEEYKNAAAFKYHCDSPMFQKFAAGIGENTELAHLRYYAHA